MNQLKNANNMFNASSNTFLEERKNMSRWISLRFKIIINKMENVKKNIPPNDLLHFENAGQLIPDKINTYIAYLNKESMYNQYVERQIEQSKHMLERSCILIEYLILKFPEKKKDNNLSTSLRKCKKQFLSIKNKNSENTDRVCISPSKNIVYKKVDL